MLDCSKVSEFSSRISIVVDCQQVGPDLLRITTNFKYPDGSFIDLFLKEQPDSLYDSFVVTDLGETTAYLLELNIRPWKTTKRKEAIARICQTLGVTQDGGELQIKLAQYEAAKLPEALLNLAQCCIRVSDLTLGYQLRSVSGFKDDVEEFLDGTGFPYEIDVPLKGSLANIVTVDFQVEGPHRTSIIQTLSASNSVVGAHVAHDLFSKWYDIRILKPTRNFITVFDSSTDVFREPDLLRFEDFSSVIGFPDEQQELLNNLAA